MMVMDKEICLWSDFEEGLCKKLLSLYTHFGDHDSGSTKHHEG